MHQRVLLGMSGGIDSSVAAILLQQQGYEVVGVTFRFLPAQHTQEAEQRAIQLAQKLGIQHFIYDAQKEFRKQIIDYFTEDYLKGRTPFPCTQCNRKMKWPLLLELADQHQCQYVATGHYANIRHINQTPYITQATDPEKDQSFFLWPLLNMPIKRMILPLGKLTKQQVIQIAIDNGCNIHIQTKESTSICFCPKDYRDYIAQWAQDNNIEISEGKFTDENGDFLASHKGYPYFTIGQRRGLGTHFNRALYVKEINPHQNEVILAPHSSLYRNNFIIDDCIFPTLQFATHPDLWVKIRYRKQATPCRLRFLSTHQAEVLLGEPLDAIAPGQTAVFYIGDTVVGGGFIS